MKNRIIKKVKPLILPGMGVFVPVEIREEIVLPGMCVIPEGSVRLQSVNWKKKKSGRKSSR